MTFSALLLGIGLTLCTLACTPADVTSTKPRDGGAPSLPGTAGASGGPPLSLPDAGQALDLPPVVPETCAEESHAARRIPLDVFILLDGSGSMNLEIGMKTKLQIVREAINAFLSDAGSAGLSVGLSIFPSVTYCETDAECPAMGGIPGLCMGFDSGCISPGETTATRVCGPGLIPCAAPSACVKIGRCGGSTSTGYCSVGSTCPSGAPCAPELRKCAYVLTDECGQTRYGKPLVAFGELPGAFPALTTALERRQPTGGTPLGEAVIGTLPFLKAHMVAHPDRRVVLVIASDGAPDGLCGGKDRIVELLREARTTAPALSTYGIGVFGEMDFAEGRALMHQLATAGGTDVPYVLEQNLNLAETFLKALAEIRGAALPCEFMIPAAQKAAIDYGKVNLRWKHPAGEETVGYVGSPDRCDSQRGGWHYDVDPKSGGKPTRVVVCPATCARLKADDKGKVELRFGCQTVAID